MKLRRVGATVAVALAWAATAGPGCIGNDLPVAPLPDDTTEDGGVAGDSSNSGDGGTAAETSTDSGPSETDGGGDSATVDSGACTTLTEGFEIAGWTAAPTWTEVTASGGTRDLAAAAHSGTQSIQFKATAYNSVARLNRAVTSTCAVFRFEAWVNIKVGSSGDGTWLVEVLRDGGKSVNVSLVGSVVVLRDANGTTVIQQTLTHGVWTRLALDINGATGEVGMDIGGRKQVFLGAGKVTQVGFGILGAVDGGEAPDTISYDDVSVIY